MINIEKLYRFFLTAIVIAIMIYIIGLGYINQHEMVHRYIYHRYGIDSVTKIDPRTISGVTVTLGNEENCNDYCRLQHGINDVIGYSVAIMIFTSWSIVVALLIIKGIWRRKWKSNTLTTE